jgi:ribosomal protein S18 acetylase RimI-like enzyme
VRLLRPKPHELRFFWPYVRGTLPLRRPGELRRYLSREGGDLLYLQAAKGTPGPAPFPPPFILFGRWRNDEGIAVVQHLHASRKEKEILITLATGEKLASDSELVITRPVTPFEARDYAACGFRELERIVLLEKELNGLPSLQALPNLEVRRFKRKWLQEVICLDEEAFDPFWRLDARTLLNISRQCHRNLFLMAFVDGKMAGYAIGGVNGRSSYLQRLCVHPLYQGLGIGKALALQTLRWARGRGAMEALVNTQEGNGRALGLYSHLGFREMDRRVIMGKGRVGCAFPGESPVSWARAEDPSRGGRQCGER